MNQPKTRSTNYLIIAEGEDDAALCQQLCTDLAIPADVIPAKSKDNIRAALKAAIKIPGPKVTKIGVMRDAEDSAENQFSSAADALSSSGFPRPTKSMVVIRDAGKAAAVLINPPYSATGSIENLMLDAVAHLNAFRCTEQMMDCLKTNNAATFNTPVVALKAQMAIYLAACATDRTRHRVGLGVSSGAFDLNATCLDPIKDVLVQLSR